MARERDMLKIFLQNPELLREYLKYLKKTDSKYKEDNKRVVDDIEPVLKELRQYKAAKNEDHPDFNDVKELLSELDFLCTHDSWKRFLNSRNKKKNRRETSKVLRKFQEIEDKKIKLRNQKIDSEDQENISSLLESIETFLAENSKLPNYSKNEFTLILQEVFTDLALGEDGLLGLEFEPRKNERAKNWIKRVVTLLNKVDLSKLSV